MIYRNLTELERIIWFSNDEEYYRLTCDFCVNGLHYCGICATDGVSHLHFYVYHPRALDMIDEFLP